MVLNRLLSQAGLDLGDQKGTSGIPSGFQSSKTTLNESNLMSGDVSIKSGKYILLGEYQIGAQQYGEAGQGDSSLDPMEQGRPYFKIQNSSPSVLKGWIKVTHESAQGGTVVKVAELRSEELNNSTKSERIVLPKSTSKGKPPVQEDSYIRIYMKADSDDTVSQSDTTLRMPVTLYE